MTLPLAGIRVLEVASMMAGPLAATLLADMGADVIKLEPPLGDESRRIGPAKGQDSGAFVGINRNKRSARVDLTTEGGRRVLRDLLLVSDIVIENLRHRAKARLGLDYASVRALNPRAICVSVSAFGESGPDAHRPGVDPAAQAVSGLMSVTGEKDGAPLKAGAPVGDGATSIMLAYGAMVALWARERTGEGQSVGGAILDTLIHIQAPYVGQYFLCDWVQPRMGNEAAWYAPYNSFLCKDGRFIHVACYNDKFFAALCDAIGRDDLAHHPDFATNDSRVENREALNRILSEFFMARTRDEVDESFRRHDIIFAPVNDYREALADRQVMHNGMVQEVEHQTIGRLRVPGVPLRLSSTPGSVRRPPPTLGQHTEEVLAELGYSTTEIQDLYHSGAAAGPVESAQPEGSAGDPP